MEVKPDGTHEDQAPAEEIAAEIKEERAEEEEDVLGLGGTHARVIKRKPGR